MTKYRVKEYLQKDYTILYYVQKKGLLFWKNLKFKVYHGDCHYENRPYSYQLKTEAEQQIRYFKKQERCSNEKKEKEKPVKDTRRKDTLS